MRPLSDPHFLELWERGRRFDPLDQGLLALTAALPEVSSEELADWPLGRKNQALAELRCASFGPSLKGWTSCARCGEKLEFELDCRALTDRHLIAERVAFGGQSFRLPTSRDLARVADETDVRSAAIQILEACRLEFDESRAFSEEDLEAVGERMARADPMAETRLTLHCPECGREWEETLNISAFLWAEIESRARRLLMDTHTLASAYGWTEREVFSLSDKRRALYVEMIQR